jgi:BolA protein
MSSLLNSQRMAMMRERLAVLAPIDLDILDESHKHAGHVGAQDGRGHFALRIVSSAFEGLPPLARHRRVYDALGTMMQTDIHALSLKTSTPSEQQ